MKERDWYINFIIRECDKLEDGKFTGNAVFQFNMKEGGIANMNCVLTKSVRKPKEVADGNK